MLTTTMTFSSARYTHLLSSLLGLTAEKLLLMNKYIADIEQIYCCFSAYKKTKLFDCSLSPQKMIDGVKKLG